MFDPDKKFCKILPEDQKFLVTELTIGGHLLIEVIIHSESICIEVFFLYFVIVDFNQSPLLIF